MFEVKKGIRNKNAEFVLTYAIAATQYKGCKPVVFSEFTNVKSDIVPALMTGAL